MKYFLMNLGNIQTKIKYFLYLVLLVSVFILPNEAFAQLTYSISKSNNAPNPVESGQPFTYTITYNWSGGAPGTLYIQDIVPSSLEVLSAVPSGSASTISGNQVDFELTGLTNPSGSGTVQINARFKPGVTCGGIQACNTALITDHKEEGERVFSNSDCVTSAEPENMWNIEKSVIAGCAVDDEVIYRICITAPGGSNIGGLNLHIDSLSDLLPADAEILGVTGNWTGPNGTVSTGNYINLTGGPAVLQVNSYPLWYCTYVRVKYPSSSFSAGDQVDNIAKLTFHTPCDTVPQVWTDTVSTTLCEGVLNGTLNKYFKYDINFYNNPYYFPTFTSNCCGEYNMWYRNTGTLTQTNVTIDDTLSGDVDVNSIKTSVPNNTTPVTVEVFTWNGSSCNTTPAATYTYTTSGFKTENSVPADICRVKWTYGEVPVNTIIRQYLDVCVRDVNFKTGDSLVPGYTTLNQMEVNADTLQLLDQVNIDVDTTSPNVVATKLFTGECDNGQVNPNGPFIPGDVVRYRMAVANLGNEDATLANIVDNLPSGFTYAGNETYYYGSFNYNINQYNPPCDDFTSTVPTQVGGSITSPSIGDNSLQWDFPVLPARCDGMVEFFLIEFDVQLSDNPPVLAGQHDNTFTFDADNSPSVPSNVAVMTVNAISELQTKKEVRLQGSGNAFSNTADIPQGQTAEYKLTVINTGNTPLTGLCLLDIMPWVGDINVLPPYNARNSQFDLQYNPADGAITTSPSGFTVTYNTNAANDQKNPSRVAECGGFCGITDPTGAVAGTWGSSAPSYSFKVNANSGTTIPAGNSLEVIVPVKMPANATINDTACNSFAMQAVPAGLPNVCLSTESNRACVVAKEPKGEDTCLVVEDYMIECKGQDADLGQIYGLSTTLYSGVGTTTNIEITSPNAVFTNIQPSSLNSGISTSVTADFTTSLSAGDTLCFVIELKNKEGRTLCKERVCVEIPECEDTPDECKCPFDFKIEQEEADQIEGTTFAFGNLISTSVANLKWVRATIVKAVVTENCGNVITTYNTGAVFESASQWAGISAIGTGTPSIIWNSKECDSLKEFNPQYKLDIPFTSAPDCRVTVELCIRYEFLDCKCNYCDDVICTTIEVKDPIVGIIEGDGLNNRNISSNVYPNPITNELNIDYSLKSAGNVNLVVRDLTGKTAATLVNSEMKTAGDYTVSMQTNDLPSGVYIYTIETETESLTKRFVIKK